MFNLIVLGKQRKINIKRLIFVISSILLLTMVVFSLTGSVSAEPETVLTGCLHSRSGELNKVAIGFEPLKACNSAEAQVTWSSGVPGLESRVVALEEGIAELENDLAPLNLTVNCPEESIGEALAQAGDRTAHVTITIIGVCTEEVRITRDNTTLRGASPGDGIQAPSPNNWAVFINDAHGINLEQFTSAGGYFGLFASNGATFRAQNLHISGADNACVSAHRNATGSLENSTIENCATGLSANAGGFIDISDATIENNNDGVSVRGGHVTINNGSVIQNNARDGVTLDNGGTVGLGSGTRISNNGDDGVSAGSGGSLTFGHVIIEYNGGDGIILENGATAQFRLGADGGTIIQYNIGEGIEIGTMSSAHIPPDATEQIQVIGNTGTAVSCIEENVFQITNRPGTISGNGSDVVDCMVEE